MHSCPRDPAGQHQRADSTARFRNVSRGNVKLGGDGRQAGRWEPDAERRDAVPGHRGNATVGASLPAAALQTLATRRLRASDRAHRRARRQCGAPRRLAADPARHPKGRSCASRSTTRAPSRPCCGTPMCTKTVVAESSSSTRSRRVGCGDPLGRKDGLVRDRRQHRDRRYPRIRLTTSSVTSGRA